MTPKNAWLRHRRLLTATRMPAGLAPTWGKPSQGSALLYGLPVQGFLTAQVASWPRWAFDYRKELWASAVMPVQELGARHAVSLWANIKSNNHEQTAANMQAGHNATEQLRRLGQGVGCGRARASKAGP